MSFRERAPRIINLAMEIYLRERVSQIRDSAPRGFPSQREIASMAIQEAFHVEDEMWVELGEMSCNECNE